MSRPRPRLLSRPTREWLEAFAAALCLAAIIALLRHAGPFAELGPLHEGP